MQLEPDNAALRQEFGAALLDSGWLPEAADNLATAIRLDPKLATAHFQLGLAFARWGRAEDAIASYRAAIAVAPKLADAHYELGSLLSLGRARMRRLRKHSTARPRRRQARVWDAWQRRGC